MGDLVRALVLCGLLSGTQPVTIMGLLLVMTGARPRPNGWAFVGGAFVVESGLLLTASLVFGATIGPSSSPGRLFLAIRIALGFGLVVIGVLLRRPPRKPTPEIPESLARLQGLTPGKSFVAGIVLADYQGPVIGSLAIASAQVGLSGRFLALGLYTLLATGIPVAIILLTTRSARAHDKLTGGTAWVMKNRRRLASWVTLVMGLFLISDAAIGLLSL